MQDKQANKAKRSEKVDQQRRKVVKLIAAGGAGAIASPWMFQSSRAAGKTIKIGMVSPETGPIAAFGEAVQLVAAGVRKQLADGITIAGEIQSGRNHLPRTASPIRTAPRKSRRSSSTTTRSTS